MMFLLIFSFFIVNMRVSAMDEWNLIINQKKVENASSIIFEYKTVWFPLRTVFEELGATVNWIEETGDTKIIYKDKEYLCEIKAPNPYFPETKYIYIKNVQNDNYFLLTSMSIGGVFTMIDDRIYLWQDTGIRLLEALGCQVNVDMETQTVTITN